MKIKFYFGIAALLLAGGAVLSACSDDDDVAINTTPIISEVTTGDAAATAVSATFTGTVKDLSSQNSSAYTVGTVYATDSASVRNLTGTQAAATLDEDGNFSVEATGLQSYQTYYYATFVTLQGRITKVGDIKSFVTTNATASTAEATGVTATKATLGGQLHDVVQLPSNATLSAGILLSTSSEKEDLLAGKDIPVADVASAQQGTAFTSNVTGLLPNKTYYYVSYMKLNNGYILGDVKSFTTQNFETQFVDLGLSVMWAKTNVGAETETEAGGLYGYGDVNGLQEKTDGEYGNTDIAGDGELDIAVQAGGRLPSVTEAKELVDKCKFEDATVDGVSVYKVTGPNGNYIYIPKAGKRVGSTITGQGSEASLWTGTINSNDSKRAYTLNPGTKSFGSNLTYEGISARAVKQTLINFDNSKIVLGDNGDDARIEIYNEYGNSKNDPGLNPAGFMFSKKMYVTFTILGMPAGKAPFDATIAFADASWDPSDWATSVKVNGNGTYTIPVTVSQTAQGLMVFVIDLKGQKGLFADGSVKAFINSIVVDDDNYQKYGTTLYGEKIDQDKVAQGDIENNGKYRIELYNAYSTTKDNPPFSVSNLSFSNLVAVTFRITGIQPGQSHRADIMYADQSWGVSNWGENKGSVNVTDNGIYTVAFYTGGATAMPAPNVFTVDIDGLSAAFGADKIHADILGVYWN